MGFVKKKETFNKKQQHFGVAFWVLGGGASIVKWKCPKLGRGNCNFFWVYFFSGRGAL